MQFSRARSLLALIGLQLSTSVDLKIETSVDLKIETICWRLDDEQRELMSDLFIMSSNMAART